MRGALPKPDVLKIADGTLRKCRQRKTAKSNHKIPPCPFPSESIAGKKWLEVCTGLERLGLIDDIDATHIEGYCRAYEMAKDADELIAKSGMVLPTANGSYMKNPACTVSADAWNKVRSYGNDLGLNYLSRQRMDAKQPEDQSELEQLIG